MRRSRTPFLVVAALALASAAFLVQGANRIYRALQLLAAGSTGDMASDLVEKGSHSLIGAAVFATLAVLAGLLAANVRRRRG